ncbi:MAG: hypothetical protein Kow00108_00870 [Calditrichia bacterium]
MTKYTKNELEVLKRNDLVELAKKRKIKNYSRMKKNQLIRALLKSQDESIIGKSTETKLKKKIEEKVISGELRKQEDDVKKYADADPSQYSDKPEAKFDLGPIEKYPQLKKYKDVPDSYGQNKIVLMVRDPYWVFSYWELSPDYLNDFFHQNHLVYEDKEYVLRLYKVSDSTDDVNEKEYLDFPLHSMTNKYYMNVPSPDCQYVVDFGVKVKGSRFYTILRSNRAYVPRDTMSPRTDEQWITLADEESFRRIYQLSGGEVWKTQQGSETVYRGKDISAHISSGVSSFVSSDFASGLKKRNFWMNLDAELIVYGATEPDARVTIDGKEIRLNEDGTFSIRLSFPNGTIHLPVEAMSADGVESIEITPTFHRLTNEKKKLLKE